MPNQPRAACFALLTLAACGGASPAAETAQPPAPATPLDFRSAVAAARDRAPDATPIEVEHERLDGAPALEVEVLEAGAIRELYFDPETGALLREGTETLEPDEAATLPALEAALADGTITLEDAIDFALTTYPGEDIREIELELHDTRLVLEVTVHRAGQNVELVHDARTRELLGEERE